MKYGLSEAQLQEIVDILSSYPEVEQAILFGSRAMGTYKEASDVDIAIKGEKADFTLAARIKSHLEDETYLPFFFDIIAYNSIDNDALKRHIRKFGVVIFTRDLLKNETRSKWKTCLLGDLVQLNYGKSLPSHKRDIGKVPVYSSAGHTGYHSEALIHSEGLVIGRKGTIGKVYKVKEPFYAIDTTYYITPNEQSYNLDFIYYLLQTLKLEDLNEDSAVPGLNRNTVYSQEVSFPPLSEQKAIAEILSSLDDKIELLHRQNKTLEALADTLFRQWFIEEAEDDWEEVNVEEIAKHVKINIIPSNNPQMLFSHYSLPAFDAGQEPCKEYGSSILSNKYKVVSNSILVSKLNPKFPRIWAVSEDIGDNAICSTEFQVFIPKNIELFGFLLCLLKSAEARYKLVMAASGTSGSHQRVSPKDILGISFKIPSIQKAIDFSNLTQPYITKIQKNHIQIKILEQLRDTLIPKLMNGSISIECETLGHG